MYNSYDSCDDKISNFALLESGPEFQTGFLLPIRTFLVSFPSGIRWPIKEKND